jgi:hypothetical protein
MGIQVKTYVSIDAKPRLKPSAAFKSKKGDLYPDSLEVSVTEEYEYTDKDGNPVDGERGYIISISGSSQNEGVISEDVKALNVAMRSYDFRKYPLQFETEMFSNAREYSNDVKQMITKNGVKSARAVVTAKELLDKMKVKQ